MQALRRRRAGQKRGAGGGARRLAALALSRHRGASGARPRSGPVAPDRRCPEWLSASVRPVRRSGNVSDKKMAARREEAGASSAAEFPADREKSSEFLSFGPIPGEAVPKGPTIRSRSAKIPYAAEQGINSAEQGIKVPCSAENRDISRLVRRFPRAGAAGRKIAGYQRAEITGPSPRGRGAAGRMNRQTNKISADLFRQAALGVTSSSF